MAAVVFYLVVLTFAGVFLLTVAHDEVTGIARSIFDMLHS